MPISRIYTLVAKQSLVSFQIEKILSGYATIKAHIVLWVVIFGQKLVDFGTHKFNKVASLNVIREHQRREH